MTKSSVCLRHVVRFVSYGEALYALKALPPRLARHEYRMLRELAAAVGWQLHSVRGFIAGTVKRAPRWVSSAGLEWAYRLSREPKRLWRRYLINAPRFLLILARTMKRPLSERVYDHA